MDAYGTAPPCDAGSFVQMQHARRSVARCFYKWRSTALLECRERDCRFIAGAMAFLALFARQRQMVLTRAVSKWRSVVSYQHWIEAEQLVREVDSTREQVRGWVHRSCCCTPTMVL